MLLLVLYYISKTVISKVVCCRLGPIHLSLSLLSLKTEGHRKSTLVGNVPHICQYLGQMLDSCMMGWHLFLVWHNIPIYRLSLCTYAKQTMSWVVSLSKFIQSVTAYCIMVVFLCDVVCYLLGNEWSSKEKRFCRQEKIENRGRRWHGGSSWCPKEIKDQK